MSCPRAGLLDGREARFMEHEPAYGELALVCPDGQVVHELAWQHERPVALLRNLRRLTAPGPGTNSYLVGTEASGFIVVDPGPADAGHVERLLAATRGDIRAIVCTRPSPDHAPAARLLQAASQQRTRQATPVLGLACGPQAGAASRFVPDRELRDGQQLSLVGFGVSHTLRAVHAPGAAGHPASREHAEDHAGPHPCLLFEEEGLLFTGAAAPDGGASPAPPTGGALAADEPWPLERLQALCEQHHVDTLLPARGHAIGPALESIAALRRHRLLGGPPGADAPPRSRQAS